MQKRAGDDGFSLVEVIIAMFLLMVIAVAVLPLMIGATRASVVNRDVVSATTFANSQLAPIKAAFPTESTSPTSCAALRTRAVPAASAVSDPAGTGHTATVAVASCPSGAASYPTTVVVTVTVRAADGDVLVTLPTRIPVASA
ncbi:type IV pilus modification PilV family protein [Microbacterium sp. bgisy189]|uniref:type IV pilus modification PilV family protein n=1 Tax=Microbacterium sp. bgisy189 TaxID=3413798 RepID=UPI003EB94FF0